MSSRFALCFHGHLTVLISHLRFVVDASDLPDVAQWGTLFSVACIIWTEPIRLGLVSIQMRKSLDFFFFLTCKIKGFG